MDPLTAKYRPTSQYGKLTSSHSGLEMSLAVSPATCDHCLRPRSRRKMHDGKSFNIRLGDFVGVGRLAVNMKTSTPLKDSKIVFTLR